MKTNKKAFVLVFTAFFATFLFLQSGCEKDNEIKEKANETNTSENVSLKIGQIMTTDEASKLTNGILFHMSEYDDKNTPRKAYLSPAGYLYYIDDFSFNKIPKGQKDYEITWGFQDHQKFYSRFIDRRTISGTTKITPEIDSSDVKYKLFVQWDDYGDDPKDFINKCFASAYFDELPFTFTLQVNKEDFDLDTSNISYIHYIVTTNENEKFKYESHLNESVKTDIFKYKFSDYLEGEPVVYFITSKVVYDDGEISPMETAWIEISFNGQQNGIYFDIWK